MAHGRTNPLATTSIRQSTLGGASRHISKLWMPMSRHSEPRRNRPDETTDAVYQWFAELQLFQGKDQQGKSEKTLRAYKLPAGILSRLHSAAEPALPRPD